MSNLLEVNSLNVQFNYDETTVQAVKNVSFELRKKHILGIVGESGSGKSITAKSIFRATTRLSRSHINRRNYF